MKRAIQFHPSLIFTCMHRAHAVKTLSGAPLQGKAYELNFKYYPDIKKEKYFIGLDSGKNLSV